MDGDPNIPKVLFVDDDEMFLDLYRDFAEAVGFNASFAHGGIEALRIMEKQTIEVIVSDYHMPGMDGIDLLQRVRAEHPLIIRVIVSGHADLQVLEKAINVGHIYHFIGKPFDTDDLKKVIQNGHDLYQKRHLEEDLIQTLLLETKTLKIEQVHHDIHPMTNSVHCETTEQWEKFFNAIPSSVLSITKSGLINSYNRWTTQYFEVPVQMGTLYITDIFPIEIVVALTRTFDEPGNTIQHVEISQKLNSWLVSVRVEENEDECTVCMLPIPSLYRS